MKQKEFRKFIQWCRKMDINCSPPEIKENFEKYYNMYYEHTMDRRLICVLSVLSVLNAVAMWTILFK